MASFNRFQFLVVFAVAALLTATPALAQQPAQRQPGLRQASASDAQLAACLIDHHQQQIDLSEFVHQRTECNDVKDFAETMVTDHGEFLAKLEEYSGETRRVRRERPRNDDAAEANERRTDRQERREARRADGRLNLAALQHEVNEECYEAFQRELSHKEGSAFDQCYMGQQIGAHMHELATLKVFRSYASPEFQQMLDEAIQDVQIHLDYAKDVMRDLSEEEEGKARTDT